MKCMRCGSEISRGDRFCGACGAPAPVEKQRKNLPLWLILAVCFLGGAVLAGALVLLWPAAPEAAQSEAEFVYRPEETLSVFLKESDFTTGENYTLDMTLKVGSSVTGPITVTDEAGRVLATPENDGSGLLHASVTLTAPADRAGFVKATAGGYESAPAYFYVHPVITDAMADTLLDTVRDTAEWAAEKYKRDPYGSKALKGVAEHLTGDERVKNIWVTEVAVYFTTRDSLMGCYCDPTLREDCVGGSSLDDAFDEYLEGEDVSELTVVGAHNITNKKVCLLSFDSDNANVKAITEDCSEIVQNAIGPQGFDSFVSYADEDALNALRDDIFDCGLLVVCAHGKKDICSTGPTRYSAVLIADTFKRQSRAEDIIGEDWEMLENRNDPEYGWFRKRKDWTWYEPLSGSAPDSLIDYSNMRSCICYDAKNKEYTYQLTVRSYLNEVLSDRFFDNTVIYLGVCHQMADTELVNQLLMRNAAVVIGRRDSFTTPMVPAALNEILTNLTGKDSMTLAEALKEENIDLTSAAATRYSGADKYKSIKSYSPEQEKLNISYAWDPFRVAGQTVFSGRAVDSHGNPQKGAGVTLYRWMDHTFTSADIKKTDSEGSYTFASNVNNNVLGRALYGVQATVTDPVTGRVFEAHAAVDPLLAEEPNPVEDLLLDWCLVSGHVVDKDTGDPIPGALLTYTASDGLTGEIRTDEKGDFTCDYLPLGEFTCFASADGYEDSDPTELTLEDYTHAVLLDNIELEASETVVLLTTENLTGPFGALSSRWLSHAHVTLFNAPDPQAESRINAKLDEVYAWQEDDCASYARYGSSDSNCTYSVGFTSARVTGGVLSLGLEKFVYSGGAHPIHGNDSLSFDVGGGDAADPASAVKNLSPAAGDAFVEAMTRALAKESSGYFESPAAVARSILRYGGGHWILDESGLTVTFTPGDVAPMSEGAIEAFVPAEELRGIVPDSWFKAAAPAGEGFVTVLDSMPENIAGKAYGEDDGCKVLAIDGRVTDLTVYENNMVVAYLSVGKTGVLPMTGMQGTRKVTWKSGGREMSLTVDP